MTQSIIGKPLPRALLAMAVFLALAAARAPGLSVTVTGSWTVTLAIGDLQAGAGSDLVSTKTSLANQVLVDINPPAGLWTVSIRKTDTNWDSRLTLYARRTGVGSGAGADPTGGDTFQLVPTSPSLALPFFDGDKKRTGIPIQYEIRGITVMLGVQTFSTSVEYTVTAR